MSEARVTSADASTPDLACDPVPQPVMPTFDPSRCHVEVISYQDAAGVIRDAHYIGKLGSTSVALGLFIDGVLAGAIAFGTIPRNNARSICGPDEATKVLELTRLALYDFAPKNSESWFIGQAFKWLTANRPDINILISYADSGVGHCGTIYQATNWILTGKSTGDYVYHCEDGTTLHPRTTGWDKSLLPPGRFKPSSFKYRYVTFLGSAPRRRALRRALRWKALPYPQAVSLRTGSIRREAAAQVDRREGVA